MEQSQMTPADPTIKIAPNVTLGKNVRLVGFVNLYGCEVGDDTLIGPFVEIQKGAKIGKRCKISSHSFICEGVTIEDEVMVAHGVMFINDLFPRSTTTTGQVKGGSDWVCTPTRVHRRAAIGSNATILAGVEIGEEALIAAGAVVTKNVPPRTIVAGNPAQVLRKLENHELQ